jgi:hypothetical protein
MPLPIRTSRASSHSWYDSIPYNDHLLQRRLFFVMQHASYAAREDKAGDKQALAWCKAPCRPKMRDEFILTLGRAVGECVQQPRAHG